MTSTDAGTPEPSPTDASSPLRSWIRQAEAGQLSWSELAERLLEHERAGSANPADCPDLDRRRRCGFGEVIYGSGKSSETIQTITESLLAAGESEILVTRVDSDSAKRIAKKVAHSRYSPIGRTLRIGKRPIQVVNPDQPPCPAPIAVVTAGSTDKEVAEEALETLRWMGVDAAFIRDVGVAGPYRLLPHLQHLRKCAALVVVAGMEGALASVAGGLVSCPIVAVPTSVGYGFNLEGVTTLLSMLSSCAANVTVVNIDAGFKGGYVAGLIAHQVASASASVD